MQRVRRFLSIGLHIPDRGHGHLPAESRQFKTQRSKPKLSTNSLGGTPCDDNSRGSLHRRSGVGFQKQEKPFAEMSISVEMWFLARRCDNRRGRTERFQPVHCPQVMPGKFIIGNLTRYLSLVHLRLPLARTSAECRTSARVSPGTTAILLQRPLK